MNLPPIDGVKYGDSYMTFSVPHGTCTKRVDYTSSVPNKAKIYYGFKCCVNSIQMAEPITATFHYKQNGEEKTVTNTFAVNDYLISFENMVKSGQITDETTIGLVRALADYGHYVQPFLAKNRNWTLGTDYETLETHYTDSYNTAKIKEAVADKAFDPVNDTKGDIEMISHSLTLDSDTVINVYFRPAKGYSGTFTAAVDKGEAKAYEKGSDGRYCVRIDGISAHLLSKDHTIEVTTDHGTASVKVSALSYVDSALGYYTTDEDAQNAAAAIYAYSQAADAFKTAHPDN